MEFKYSLSILFSNVGYALRILLWILLSLILTLGIGAAIVLPICDVLVASTDVAQYGIAIKDCFAGIWDGSSTVRQMLASLINHTIDIVHALGQNVGVSIGLGFVFVFLYAFYCFVFGLSYYTLAYIINNLMASNMKVGFASSMALNLKKSAKYSGARLTITLPIDFVIITIMALIILGLFRHIGFFMVPLALIVGVTLLSLRATLLAGWLPRMLFHPEENVYTAFTRSLTYVKANASGLFKSYALTFSIVYLCVAGLSVPTGGLMGIILPSIYYFILRTIELIGYYKTKGYSFYTDATTVINTVEFGYRNEQQALDTAVNDVFDSQISIDEINDVNEEV